MDSAIDPPGISLLAYMDGVVHSRTLSAVLIASASAAGSAIYKVIFKKLMGCVTFSQVRSLYWEHSSLNIPGNQTSFNNDKYLELQEFQTIIN